MTMLIRQGAFGRGKLFLFGGLSALNDGAAIPVNGAVGELGFHIIWGAGVTGGQVVLETAHDENYAGTWANLATINWTAASKQDHIAVTGAYGALRIRISTAIVGGVVDSFIVGAAEQ